MVHRRGLLQANNPGYEKKLYFAIIAYYQRPVGRLGSSGLCTPAVPAMMASTAAAATPISPAERRASMFQFTSSCRGAQVAVAAAEAPAIAAMWRAYDPPAPRNTGHRVRDVEQGMILQNLALMTQAIGLGGFPHCPPYHASMADAVRAVVALKYGDSGIFRGRASSSAWREPARIVDAIAEPSEVAIAATIAYCSYVHVRYGRFPAYQPPFRTVLGFQVNHVDTDFCERFYRPESLGESQRRHMGLRHPEMTDP